MSDRPLGPPFETPLQEAASIVAESLLDGYLKMRDAQRRGLPWPPVEEPEPAKVTPARPKPDDIADRVFREIQERDEDPVGKLLGMTWFPADELHSVPDGGQRHRIVLAIRRATVGIAVFDSYGDVAVLRATAIKKRYRRRKHGSALVALAVRQAYATGVVRMYTAAATPWFVEEVGFVLRDRAALPPDDAELPGLIDAPHSALLFQLTPTKDGCPTPRRSVPRYVHELVASEAARRKRSGQAARRKPRKSSP